MHVTKDGKKLGTGNNFPNANSSFSYSVSSGFIFHDLLHYQLDSSMRDQKVFCVLSGLGILSNNKNTAFGMQLKGFFPIGNWPNGDFRAGCSGVGVENPQGHRFHDLSGLAVANHSHSETLPSYIW